MNIGIVGAGSFGTALACLLNNNGHNITIWSYRKEQVEKLNEERENKAYLKGVKISKNIKITSNEFDLKECNMVVFSVPSNTVRKVSNRFKEILKDNMIIVNVAKGLEENTLLRLSQIIQEVIPKSRVAILSGPSHAEEVGMNLPTVCVATAYESEVANIVQDTFMNDTFRVYTNLDIIGVEIGGALKNLIALASGASDGFGFGDNAKAALMTRGIAEIARLGVAMGANKETFSGLTGIGDLIVTCTSKHSRNRRAGILLAKGKSLDETLKEINMVVEGVNTSRAAYELSIKYKVNMPITTEINEVLYNGKNIKEAVVDLMTRNRTEEEEKDLWSML